MVKDPSITLSEKTIKDEFLTYRGQIEAGTAPKTLTGAFSAGARAALESLGNPYSCPLCAGRIIEIEQQIDAFSKQQPPPPKI